MALLDSKVCVVYSFQTGEEFGRFTELEMDDVIYSEEYIDWKQTNDPEFRWESA